MLDTKDIQQKIAAFNSARGWDDFQRLKNLVMALSVETSELLEIFQWLTPEQSDNVMQSEEAEHVQEEVADIAMYLLQICDKLNIDLQAAILSKMQKNAIKYPLP